MSMIEIGIVEDIQKTRERLVNRLGFADDIAVTLVVSNGEEALARLEECAEGDLPDMLLMDIGLPGMSGIETTILVKESFPEIKVIIQTVFEDNDRIFRSIQAGAAGYLLKDVPIDKYLEAIRDIHDGGAPITPAIATKLLSYLRNSEARQESTTPHERFNLTDREMEILEKIVEDLTEPQIADELYISPHTVRTHVKNIYKKLHVHSRASAVRFALRNNLLE